MALPKFTFGVPLLKTVEYFSVCPECQQEHSTSANGGAKPNALFKFSGNANDVKYDIIKHAIDEMDAAKLTGIDVTRDHVARTWRAKVVKECGQDSGCAKLLLAQVSLARC